MGDDALVFAARLHLFDVNIIHWHDETDVRRTKTDSYIGLYYEWPWSPENIAANVRVEVSKHLLFSSTTTHLALRAFTPCSLLLAS